MKFEGPYNMTFNAMAPLQALCAVLFLWLLATGLHPIRAQQGVNFSAFSNAEEGMVGDYFEVSFTLENVKGKNFQAPDFEGFNIVSGPNQAYSTTNVNGRWSRKLTYSYGLIAKKPGIFEIGPATIQVDGKTMRTKPITIEVKEPANRKEDVGGPSGELGTYFIKTTLSHDTAYIGQQIIIEYVLFTQVGIEHYNVLNMPDWEGFYAQYTRSDGRAHRQIVDGVTYTAKVLRRVALFAQQAGQFEIGPMTLQIGVASQRGRQSFLFSQPLRRENITSESFKISVLPLPDGAPESFNGAVGDFEMSARVRNPIIGMDDALTLEMDLRGDGDSKRLMAPDLPFDTIFDVYRPNLVNENTFTSGGRIKTEKTFEYQLLPKKEGAFSISPEFTYFDPDSKRYRTLTSDSIPIRVLPSTGISGNDPRSTNEMPGKSQGLRPLMTEATWDHTGSVFYTRPAFWVMSGLPFLLFFTTVYVRRRQLAWDLLDPRIKRQQQAGKISEQRLKRAKSYLDQVAAAEFYDEIHKALLGYISDKFQIPASEFDRMAIRQALSKQDVSPDQVEAFIQLLDRCEMALFARLDQADKMREVYEEAKGLIDRWEKG